MLKKTFLILASVLLCSRAVGEAPPSQPSTFSPAVYSARADGGRLLITIQTTVSADTGAWSDLPIGNLAIIDARVDAAPALLRTLDDVPEIWVGAGRHAVVITASSELERTSVGRAGRWMPALSGKLSAPGIRVEGARVFGQQLAPGPSGLAIGGGTEIRFVVMGEDVAVEGKGTWLANVNGRFQIGRGTVEAAIKIDLDAIGAAPDRIIIRLPDGLIPISVEGDAQELSSSGREITLRPLRDHGSAMIHAEGRFSGEEFSLDGLDLIGAGRGEVRLEVSAAEGAEVSVDTHEGVVAQGAQWRVVKRPYSLRARTHSIGGVESRKAIIDRATIATTLLLDGQRFAQIDLDIVGRPGRLLAVRLPDGAEIQSVTVGDNTVAPTRAGDSLLISLVGIENGGKVRLVCRAKNNPFHLGTVYREDLPQFGLDIRSAEWSAAIPKGTAMIALPSSWIPTDPRLTPIRAIDKITDTFLSLPSYLWIFVKWLAVALLYLAVAVGAIWLIRAFLQWGSTIKVDKAGCGLAVVLIFFIVMAVFVALGGPLRNMFSGAVGTETMGKNQAALSGGIYGDDVQYESDLSRENEIAETRLPAAMAPPPAETGRRSGGISIEVNIPRDGKVHRFTQKEMDAAHSLRMILLAKWPWRILVIIAALGSVCLIYFKPRMVSATIITAAFLDAVLPGAFAAVTFTVIIVITLNRARERWLVKRRR